MGPEGTLRVVTTLRHHGTARKQVVVYSCLPHLLLITVAATAKAATSVREARLLVRHAWGTGVSVGFG
jgi:hypothetical protein